METINLSESINQHLATIVLPGGGSATGNMMDLVLDWRSKLESGAIKDDMADGAYYNVLRQLFCKHFNIPPKDLTDLMAYELNLWMVGYLEGQKKRTGFSPRLPSSTDLIPGECPGAES